MKWGGISGDRLLETPDGTLRRQELHADGGSKGGRTGGRERNLLEKRENTKRKDYRKVS